MDARQALDQLSQTPQPSSSWGSMDPGSKLHPFSLLWTGLDEVPWPGYDRGCGDHGGNSAAQGRSPTQSQRQRLRDLRQQVAPAIGNRLDPKKQAMVCQKYPRVRGVLAVPPIQTHKEPDVGPSHDGDQTIGSLKVHFQSSDIFQPHKENVHFVDTMNGYQPSTPSLPHP